MTDEPFSLERMAQLAKYGSMKLDASSVRIRAARKLTKLSAQALADAMGVTKATVIAIENRRQLPSWEFMGWLQVNYGIKTSFCILGDASELTVEVRDNLFAALLQVEADLSGAIKWTLARGLPYRNHAILKFISAV